MVHFWFRTEKLVDELRGCVFIVWLVLMIVFLLVFAMPSLSSVAFTSFSRDVYALVHHLCICSFSD